MPKRKKAAFFYQIFFPVFFDRTVNLKNIVFEDGSHADLLVGKLLEKRCIDAGQSHERALASPKPGNIVYRLNAYPLTHPLFLDRFQPALRLSNTP